MEKLRCFCFTDFKMSSYEPLTKLCSYFIIGEETCPTTNKKHWQGYAELIKRQRFNTLRKLFDHIEPRYGTQKQAIDYCKKENILIEFGSTKQQGKRTDIDEIKDAILDGDNFKEVSLITRNYQGLRYAEKFAELWEKPDDGQRDIYWFYGDTGSGKTWTALNEIIVDAPYWKHTGNLNFWNGYQGEEYVLLDDFRKDHCDFATLLAILDKYPMRVNTKGSFRWLKAHTIIITCPYHPKQLWAREDLTQIMRRLDWVQNFGSRSWGNTIPNFDFLED